MELDSIISGIQIQRQFSRVEIGYQFLAGMNESDQERLFRSVMVSTETLVIEGNKDDEAPGVPCSIIEIGALARAMALTGTEIPNSSDCRYKTLSVSNFSFKRNQDPQELACGIAQYSRRACIHALKLKNMSVSANMKHGFLDELLLTLSKLSGNARSLRLVLTACNPTDSSRSLITDEALGDLINGREIESLLLSGLGMNNSHCRALAKLTRWTSEQQSEHETTDLDMRGNPDIGEEGLSLLTGMLNRKRLFSRILVDDKNWNANSELLIELNQHYGRLQYLRDGAFPSKRDWVEFLDNINEDDETTLDRILVTVLDNPDLVRNN